MLQAIQRCSFSFSHHLSSTKRFFYVSSRLRADPWLLPNTPEHLKSTTTSPDLPPPTPLMRPNESVDTMRARLLYQSRKRGTLESDLLLSTFARDYLKEMSEVELREYDKVRKLCGDMILFFNDACSYWTSQTGTSITGPRERGRRQNVGRSLQSWTNLACMHATREKLYAACLLCKRCLIYRQVI